MSVEPLMRLITVVGGRVEVPSADDWSRVEARGPVFPEEFKAFLSKVGTGVLAEFFYVWNPISTFPGMNWFQEQARTLDSLRTLIAKRPDEYREWRFYPERNGLLPFGKTGNGDILFWRTSGSVNQWTVAVSNGEPSIAKSEETLSTFLVNLLTIPRYCAQLPDLSSSPKTFVPLLPHSTSSPL